MINKLLFLCFGIFIGIELVLLYINNVNIKIENENFRVIRSNLKEKENKNIRKFHSDLKENNDHSQINKEKPKIFLNNRRLDLNNKNKSYEHNNENKSDESNNENTSYEHNNENKSDELNNENKSYEDILNIYNTMSYDDLDNTEKDALDEIENDEADETEDNVFTGYSGSRYLFDKVYFNTDLRYIKRYQGEELEPEWEWIKNISIVYTWVDGNDIDFLDIKSKYNGGFREYNSRDRSADELRYSIRSLTKYLPWHNGTIFILTNNQIPKWLDTTNPRVKMVFHKDIFPEYITPTYDSNTIELYLDKIPGITERFIYFNDDIFINNYIHPAFFFSSRTFYPKVYRKNKANLDKSSIVKIIKENDIHKLFQASKYFTNEIIKKYFDVKYEYLNACHSAHVFYRDLFEPFRQLFKEELKFTNSDRFRSPFKVHSIYLYQIFLQYATREDDFPNKLGGNGKAKEFKGYILPANRTIEKYSVDIVPSNIVGQLVKYGKISDDSMNNRNYFKFFRKNKNILIYNFNDLYSTEKALCEFTEYMITRYPEPSEFEKQEYIEAEKAILPIISGKSGLSTGIMKYSRNKNFESFVSNFTKAIIDFKFATIKEYIKTKESLAGPKKNLSDREIEEVDFLLKYEGKTINEQWKWAKNISIVYILENASNYNNTLFNGLKYSIRSIEKYLPWLEGDIFIITQKKVTNELSWLNTENSRIHIFNQDQIIPKEAVLTENKHVIEMYLDKIPGISEKFIYLRNNHFFINYTHPRFFFSKEFYPKYNLKNALTNSEMINERNNNKSFFYTYDIIKDYFGETYVTTYRYFKNAPFPLYRDLFEPCREIYSSYVNELLTHTKSTDNDFLSLYMVSTYNIYGTDQPYYPEFVSGYGKIRKTIPPKLNTERTINHYGFDITSPYISDNTMMLDIQFTKDNYRDQKMIKELTNTNKLFFSLEKRDKEISYDEIIHNIFNLLITLYNDKSSFEL